MCAPKLSALGDGRPSNTASIEAVSKGDAAEMFNMGTASIEPARSVRESKCAPLI